MKPLVTLFCILFFWSGAGYGTAQFPDLLIVDDDTSGIHANPLEPYFKLKGNREFGGQWLEGSCTALWRGYVAIWKLQNDSLFLVGLQINSCSRNPQYLNLKDEFDTNVVFADWMNSTIINPFGEIIQYVHMGYASIYEGEHHYWFENGIMIRHETQDFLERNDKRLVPSQARLRDTLKELILAQISDSERMQIPDSGYCNLGIVFNKNGKASKVYIRGEEEPQDFLQELLVRKAQKVIKSFPLLMKVNHPRYRHQKRITIWFSSYCIKNPNDVEYGCGR
jgi:hypothetical protein